MERALGSGEQMALLRIAASRLRTENKLRLRVRVWGRVEGVAADYWLLHAPQTPLHFYSVDLMEWFVLPPLQLEALRLAHHCTTPFTGYPAHVATFNTPQDERPVSLKEEERLAGVVAAVAKEAATAPLLTQNPPPEWIRRGGALRSLRWPGLGMRRRHLCTYRGDGRRDAQFFATL